MVVYLYLAMEICKDKQMAICEMFFFADNLYIENKTEMVMLVN